MSDLSRIVKLAGLASTSVEETPQREMKADHTAPTAPETQTEAVGEFAEQLYALQDELGLEDNILVDELARFMSSDDIAAFVSDFRRNNDMNDAEGESDVEAGTEYDDAEYEESVEEDAIDENELPPHLAKFFDKDGNLIPAAEARVQAGNAERAEKSNTDEGVCADCGCEIANPDPACDCQTHAHAPMEAAKPDFADIDGDGDKEEDMKKAADDRIEPTMNDEPEYKGKKKEPTMSESPTMDTTQLVTLMKNSGISEEAIQIKLTEWANSALDAAETESTSHGLPYEYAQTVNLSLKRYLDAEDQKVAVSEHTVENMKSLYEAKKTK